MILTSAARNASAIERSPRLVPGSQLDAARAQAREGPAGRRNEVAGSFGAGRAERQPVAHHQLLPAIEIPRVARRASRAPAVWRASPGRSSLRCARDAGDA